MDASHFDELIRSLTSGPRRGVLGVLAAAPLLGGLLAVLDPAEGEAKGQRKRHKKPHHHSKHTGNRAGKKKKRRCKPNSKATTCAGTCGSVKNNCKKTVDCGSCACNPACAVCQICQAGPNTPGACVPDPEQNGEACATGDLCITGEVCSAGVCGDGTPVVCLPQDQCHEPGVCDPDTGQCSNPEKPDGAACNDGDACTQTDTCQSGVCSGSNPVICNACQLPDSCNPDTGQCAPDPAKQHTCDGPCPSGEWCDAGACADIQATVTILDCQSLCDGSTQVCGQTVTCPSCQLCPDQTGCAFNALPDGPVGAGNYCSIANIALGTCTTNANCDPGDYCATNDFGDDDLCAHICPF
jgi:hypothetical protein